MSQSTRKILFELRGIPKFTEALPLAMQHVVAMIIGCITPAIVISVVANVSPEDTMLLIQASLVTAAIATFIQLYPVAGRVGAGIPVVMGVSFAYVPVLIAIGGSMGLPAILGAQIVGGFAAIIVGIFIRRLRPLFPPLVSGTVVFTIGLSLYPVAIRYMAGGAGMPGFGSALNWGGGALHARRRELLLLLHQRIYQTCLGPARHGRGLYPGGLPRHGLI